MNSERLLTHFDRIAEAPDAVPRLRRFILDLAVRGKLVEQDTSDEPAAELLKRIVAEKARLVKAGEIRMPKPLPAVDEPPFVLPRNWRWSRIREITSDHGKKVPETPFTYIDVTAIYKEIGVVAAAKVLEAKDAPSRARKITKKGDVIYSCVRPYLLNVAMIEEDFDPEPIASTAFAILNGHGLVLPRYLWAVLRSPFMVGCVEEYQRGQAYPAINDADFALLPFPLPPLAEQHRIVAKVDELMALCDRLEAAQTKREQRRDRLVTASLRQLQDEEGLTPSRQDAKEEKEANEKYLGVLAPWREPVFLRDLSRLTTRSEHIKTLRQTILNLAVRGRLVTQDPTDESAQDFGMAREVDQNDRLALALPDNWNWAKVEHVADARLGKMLDKAKNSGQSYRYLGNTNVHWFNIRTDDMKEWLMRPSV
jgi:type I restriction enzyme, S subunit